MGIAEKLCYLVLEEAIVLQIRADAQSLQGQLSYQSVLGDVNLTTVVFNFFNRVEAEVTKALASTGETHRQDLSASFQDVMGTLKKVPDVASQEGQSVKHMRTEAGAMQKIKPKEARFRSLLDLRSSEPATLKLLAAEEASKKLKRFIQLYAFLTLLALHCH